MPDPAMTRRAVLRLGAATMSVLGIGLSPLRARSEGDESGDESDVARLIGEVAEPLPPISDPAFASFVDRYAWARVVLLGEASHGTDEFYRARTAITERLVREHGFNVVTLEADWPEASRIDAYVRQHDPPPLAGAPFARFPAWMWRNRAVEDLIDRLRTLNREVAEPERKVGVHGLDLYSLPSSMEAVVEYARRHDPAVLQEIRTRYGCLAPWVEDPLAYGALARGSGLDGCAAKVSSVAGEVLAARLGEVEASERALFDAFMNARVVAASEAYHRAMHEGPTASWNRRDTHMFETLRHVLEARGPEAKAVVWAHNSHIGDARATGMGAMGEINLGQLARQEWGKAAALIGFGTHQGTVTAAPEWGSAPETMSVSPSLSGSWGALMQAASPERFHLDLRGLPASLVEAFSAKRMERFIGVVYLRETELFSHYIPSSLAGEYDGYVWIKETTAVEPLSLTDLRSLPEGHPLGL